MLNKNVQILVLLLFTLLVYGKIILFPGISWDDPEMVFSNQDVLNFDLKALFSHHYVGNYIPITMVVHATAYKIFGYWSGGHHLINLLLHLLNGLLLYSLTQKLFQKQLAALLGTILFLMHPLQVESVVWISELKNILSLTFLLLSILAFLKLVSHPSYQSFAWVLCLASLAMLSKPSAVVIPLLMALVLYLKSVKPSPLILILLLCLTGMSIWIGLHTIDTQKADHFINYAHLFKWPVRIGMAGYAVFNYIRLLFVPLHLSVIYPYPIPHTPLLIVGYVLLVIVLVGIIYLYKKNNRALIFSILWLGIILGPVLQLVPFGEVLYADRYVYMGVFVLGWMTGCVVRELEKTKNILIALLSLLMAILTYNRLSDWQNATTLFKSILKIYPNEYVTLNSLGVEMMNNHFDNEANYYLSKAIIAAPQNYKGYFNRGLLALKNGKPQAALYDFNKVLRMYDYTKAWSGRAAAYLLMKDYSKAVSDAKEALKRDPRNVKAHYVLAGCYNETGDIEQALREYSTCIDISGGDADTYLGRAIVFGKLKDYKSSELDLNQAILLRPDFYEAYYWRAVVLINSGRSGCNDLTIAAQQNFTPAIQAYQKYCQ